MTAPPAGASALPAPPVPAATVPVLAVRVVVLAVVVLAVPVRAAVATSLPVLVSARPGGEGPGAERRAPAGPSCTRTPPAERGERGLDGVERVGPPRVFRPHRDFRRQGLVRT
ncbi:hypothetical protein ACDF64_04060 [Agromyces sp. MMS24-JH15]|uniref:hypothetical protein n=1 Tax=Agromyces sp. MMS24-JH15 TaxID=3243765 RepID=UPI0037480F8C